MGRVLFWGAVSLDGYLADADGELDWLTPFGDDPAIAAHIDTFLATVGAIAMGATTYEYLMASQGWVYGSIPSYIFSNRELPLPEDSSVGLVAGAVGPRIDELVKQAGDRDVWVVGGGPLVRQCLEVGSLSDLVIQFVPVILGGGAPLMPTGIRMTSLALVSVTPLAGGILEAHYQVV